MKKNTKSIFLMIFIVAIVLSAPILLNRIELEQNNDTYQITISLESTLSMNQKDLHKFYKDIKSIGVTTVVSDNINLKALENYRDIEILSLREFKLSDNKELMQYIPKGANKDNIVIKLNKSDFLDREVENIEDYLDGDKVYENEDKILYFIDKPLTVMKDKEYVINPILSQNFFIDEKSIKEVIENGLNVMLAITNDKNDSVQDRILEQVLYLSKEYNINTVQLRGETILGYKGNLNDYIDKLQENNISVVTTEFQTKTGLTTYANKNKGTVLRGHEINVLGLRLDERELASRISRAVKERNMRVIALRNFIDYSNDSTVRDSVKDIKKSILEVQSQLEGNFNLGTAKPIPMMDRHMVQEVFVAISFAALIGLLAISIYSNKVKLSWLMFGLALVGALLATFVRVNLFIKAYAFGVAVIGSVSAVIIPWKYKNKSFILKYIMSFIISIATGVMISCIMYGTSYMLKLQSFAGIKPLYVLPPIIVAVWILMDLNILTIENIKSPDKIKDQAIDKIKNIKLYHFVFLGVILVAAYVYISRSGNTGTASEAELYMRELLEKLLYARPRTKEFMLGYPALLIALYLYKNKSKYAVYLLIPAAIATMSTVNTFTHLHTPFLYSLLRSIYGVLFGAIVAAIYILIAKIIIKLIKRFNKEV